MKSRFFRSDHTSFGNGKISYTGVVVGSKVGSGVGSEPAPEGSVVGPDDCAWEGLNDIGATVIEGTEDGLVDGRRVGEMLVPIVSKTEGETDGAAVGLRVGKVVLPEVGKVDRLMDGFSVGMVEGKHEVGIAEGGEVGFTDGERLGPVDGNAVGLKEGKSEG